MSCGGWRSTVSRLRSTRCARRCSGRVAPWQVPRFVAALVNVNGYMAMPTPFRAGLLERGDDVGVGAAAAMCRSSTPELAREPQCPR